MTATQLDTFDVTLEVLVPDWLKPEKRVRLGDSVGHALEPALRRISSGSDIADALGLPLAVPVDLRLRVVGDEAGERAATRDVPVRATVAGGPELLHVRFDAVADVLGDLLYEALQPVAVPSDVVEALGGEADGTERFDLCFGEDEAMAVSRNGAITDAYCEAGYYSWSKGCSSWPW
jgi:hypothetical protein